jgi:outer membrane receptor for ferrienterochelin and colicin
MDNYELNLSKEFNDSKEKVELNAYYSTYRNLILWGDLPIPQDALLYLNNQGVEWEMINYEGTINAPDFSSEGLELVFHWKPANNVKAQLIYGYSRVASMTAAANAQLLLADNQQINWAKYPTHSLKANVETLLFKKLNVNVAATYDSAFNVNDYVGDPSYGPMCPDLGQPRIVCDIALLYKATQDLSVKLNVKNVFANQVPLSGTYNWFPYPGQQGLFSRLVYLTVNYKIM